MKPDGRGAYVVYCGILVYGRGFVVYARLVKDSDGTRVVCLGHAVLLVAIRSAEGSLAKLIASWWKRSSVRNIPDSGQCLFSLLLFTQPARASQTRHAAATPTGESDSDLANLDPQVC